MDVRDYAVAQHEAAHVVVGVACGLRLKAAIVGARAGAGLDGVVLFRGGHHRHHEAWALMFAAGIAWDRIAGNPAWWSRCDRAALGEFTSGRCGAEVVVRAATAMLWGMRREHARVTGALMARDLRGEDIAALARGEAVDP